MIAYLEGSIISVEGSSIVIKVNGVGYEVNMPKPSLELLEEGENIKLFISESISPYDGTVLYGFLSRQELELFKLLRSSVANTGAKKALEYLSKAVRSLPDFKKAITGKDDKIMTGVFGFTHKTAVKLINALKDKVTTLKISGEGRIKIEESADGRAEPVLSQVFQALVSLGFSAAQSKRAVESLYEQGIDKDEKTEVLIKKALKVMS